MFCPRCKVQVDQNLMFCPNCNLKLKIICKKCNQPNIIGIQTCQNCNSSLIKFCQFCKASNLNDAIICRKCGKSFSDNKKQQSNKNLLSSNSVKFKIKSALLNNEIKIIGLWGDDSYSKNLLIKYITKEIKGSYDLIYTNPDHLSELSPFGLVVDIIINFFNLPDFISSKNEILIKLHKYLSFLSKEEFDTALNIIYPCEINLSGNIFENYEKSKNILFKIFSYIFENKKILLLINDFDLIDNSSFDFLRSYVDNKFISEDHKLVLTYRESKTAQDFFSCNNLQNKNYFNIYLDKITFNLASSLIDALVGDKYTIPIGVKTLIYNKSGGSSIFIEEIIFYLIERGIFYKNKNGKLELRKNLINDKSIPDDYNDIIKFRLGVLKSKFFNAYKVLILSSILGVKFNIHILFKISELSETHFNKVLSFLKARGYFKNINEHTQAFRHRLLWQSVYELGKLEPNYKLYNEKLLIILRKYILVNTSIKCLLAQNTFNLKDAYDNWNKNSKIAFTIGDINLYIISQKQCLRFLKKLEIENKEEKILFIEETLGKILANRNQKEAFDYLICAINYYKKNNNSEKVIELSSYLLNVSYFLKNNFACIEVVDNVANYLDDNDFKLEKSIILSKKLSSLFNIGNYEEIVFISDNKILPNIEIALKSEEKNLIDDETLYNVWIDTQINTLNALAITCSDKFISRYQEVNETITLNRDIDFSKLYKLKLSEAIYSTFIGEINISDKILEEMLLKNNSNSLKKEIISRINLIYSTNRILCGDFNIIKPKLLEYAVFANNCNDEFSKNMFRVYLAIVYKNECDFKKAYDILNEQIEYFSNEKIAPGALLCWYLIAALTLKLKGTDNALDIANRAIEITKSSKINNNWFVCLYYILLSDIYTFEGDFDSSKMYLEKALAIVSLFNIKYLKILIYLGYGRLFEREIIKNEGNREFFALNALKMYADALKIAQKLNLVNYIKISELAKESLINFCKNNKIVFG